MPLKAGLRTIGVSFPKKLALEETWCRRNDRPAPHQARHRRAVPMDVQVDGAEREDPDGAVGANGPGIRRPSISAT